MDTLRRSTLPLQQQQQCKLLQTKLLAHFCTQIKHSFCISFASLSRLIVVVLVIGRLLGPASSSSPAASSSGRGRVSSRHVRLVGRDASASGGARGRAGAAHRAAEEPERRQVLGRVRLDRARPAVHVARVHSRAQPPQEPLRQRHRLRPFARRARQTAAARLQAHDHLVRQLAHLGQHGRRCRRRHMLLNQQQQQQQQQLLDNAQRSQVEQVQQHVIRWRRLEHEPARGRALSDAASAAASASATTRPTTTATAAAAADVGTGAVVERPLQPQRLHKRQPRGRLRGARALHRHPGPAALDHRRLLAHGVGAAGKHHRHDDQARGAHASQVRHVLAAQGRRVLRQRDAGDARRARRARHLHGAHVRDRTRQRVRAAAAGGQRGQSGLRDATRGTTLSVHGVARPRRARPSDHLSHVRQARQGVDRLLAGLVDRYVTLASKKKIITICDELNRKMFHKILFVHNYQQLKVTY